MPLCAWLCLKAVDLIKKVLARARFANDRPASRSLISLGARFTKASLFVVLVIAVLSLLGLRIRTLDRTIITVPNGKLADEQVETFAARDRLRLFSTLGLRYGSSPEQLRAALAELDAALRTRFEKVDASSVVIRLVSLGEWSIGVEVAAMVNTADWDEFTAIRQQVLLHVMSVLESGGVHLQPVPLLSPTEPAKGNNGAPRALSTL